MLSTDRIRAVDPAGATEQSSMLVPINVFQRLMSAEPGQSVLRPDAARDCLFTGETIFTCTLNDDLFFHNGNPVTSRDVKFSIDRAMRLAVPGSSAVLLDAIRRVETPDPRTVRFVLGRLDSQIGWALASPAASIVDSKTYDADNLRAADQPIVGSGPFAVTAFSGNTIQLAKYEKYVGRTPAQSEEITYQTVADSASIEDAMAKGTVDVAWRGLNGAAITRFGRQIVVNPGKLTDDGYTIQPYTGVRIRMLQLSADAIRRLDRPKRQAIAVALQGDRTLDSIVPGGVTGNVSSFPLGGKARAQDHLVEPHQPHPRLRPHHSRRSGPGQSDPYPAGGHRRDDRPAAARRARHRPRAGRPQGVHGDRAGLAAAVPGEPAAGQRGPRSTPCSFATRACPSSRRRSDCGCSAGCRSKRPWISCCCP